MTDSDSTVTVISEDFVNLKVVTIKYIEDLY
jgi:hypothetical protein